MQISIEQSMTVSGIVFAFLGFVVHDWQCAVELTNYGGPTGALRTVGYLIIFLVLLKTG